MNIYEFVVHIECPVDSAVIAVKTRIEHHDTIMVEDLSAKVVTLQATAMMQEQFTDSLHTSFGGYISTVGIHGGVTINCIRGVKP